MKRILFSAVGALGALGTAGMIAMAAPASADTCESITTPFAHAACVAAATNAETFGQSISPEYNRNVLINGTVETINGIEKNSGLGLKDQLNGSTFKSSVGDFMNGPRSPSAAPEAATGSTP